MAFIDKMVSGPGTWQESVPSISVGTHSRHDQLPSWPADAAAVAGAGAGASTAATAAAGAGARTSYGSTRSSMVVPSDDIAAGLDWRPWQVVSPAGQAVRHSVATYNVATECALSLCGSRGHRDVVCCTLPAVGKYRRFRGECALT